MSKIVNYEEILDLPRKSGVYFIDVRELKEIEETGMIPGSMHIPMGQIQQELVKMDEKSFKEKYEVDKPKLDSPIIVTCRSGRRAETVMIDLEKVGYTNCKYYKGSWLEYAEKNAL